MISYDSYMSYNLNKMLIWPDEFFLFFFKVFVRNVTFCLKSSSVVVDVLFMYLLLSVGILCWTLSGMHYSLSILVKQSYWR